MSRVEASAIQYGVDLDRAQAPESPVAAARRRLSGRYPIDPFGADPQVQDLAAPVVQALVRVRMDHPERIPRSGPALLVSNRGLGLVEPTALSVAVRRDVGRRLRVVGAPDLPVVGDVARKLGAVMSYGVDLAALLRAGHIAVVPLGPTWLRTGTGTPPLGLLEGALGYPVIPVAVMAGGPLGLPLRAWRVSVGEPVELDSGLEAGDPLAAAELAEAARAGVRRLVDSTV